MPASLDAEHVAEAVRRIRRSWDPVPGPRWGIILGTGLGTIAESIDRDCEIPYAEIPHFPRSSAPSHKSVLVCGRFAGAQVVVMNGRCHLYEGYGAGQLGFPVRVMHQLGAAGLIVSNAAGGLNPQFRHGDLMLIEDHINLMWQVASPMPQRLPGGVAGSPYRAALIEIARQTARRNQFPIRQGVYVSVTGPTYETRAEYRLFRRIGGDAVGMSTIPEVSVAAQLGMHVLGLSLITNVALPDAPEQVDAEDVVRVAERAAPRMRAIVEAVIDRSAGQA